MSQQKREGYFYRCRFRGCEAAFYDSYGLLEVKFKGTMAQWEAIEKNRLWDVSCSIDEVICLDGTVTL